MEILKLLRKSNKEYEEIQCIHICVDEVVDTGDLKLSDKDFNYNTLEPKILKENGREAMNNILELTTIRMMRCTNICTLIRRIVP